MNPAFQTDSELDEPNLPKPGTPEKRRLSASFSDGALPRMLQNGSKGSGSNPSGPSSNVADVTENQVPTEKEASPSTSDVQPKDGVHKSTSFPGVSAQRRKSSMADVAFALSSPPDTHFQSLADALAGTRRNLYRFSGKLKRSANRYVHPYGNSKSLVEEMFETEEAGATNGSDNSEEEKVGKSSPAKFIVWIIFTCFMVGVAASIIFAAGRLGY